VIRLEAPAHISEAHVTAQRARKPRRCEDYPDAGCWIEKGEQYVTWTVFPDSDIMHGLTRPSRLSICLRHSHDWVLDALCDHGSYWTDERGARHCLMCPRVTDSHSTGLGPGPDTPT
jgi:hypothetical protein